jgi:hypothetical protein
MSSENYFVALQLRVEGSEGAARASRGVTSSINGLCRMWEHREDMKEAEGCCVEGAIESDYIHNRMSKHVTKSHVRCSLQCTV